MQINQLPVAQRYNLILWCCFDGSYSWNVYPFIYSFRKSIVYKNFYIYSSRFFSNYLQWLCLFCWLIRRKKMLTQTVITMYWTVVHQSTRAGKIDFAKYWKPNYTFYWLKSFSSAHFTHNLCIFYALLGWLRFNIKVAFFFSVQRLLIYSHTMLVHLRCGWNKSCQLHRLSSNGIFFLFIFSRSERCMMYRKRSILKHIVLHDLCLAFQQRYHEPDQTH